MAGKTGTAELEDTRGPGDAARPPPDPSNTDAWFTAYAPAGRPRIAVAVLLVRAGAGGADGGAGGQLVLRRGAVARRARSRSSKRVELASSPSSPSISSSSGRFSVSSSGQLEEQHRARRRAQLGHAAGLRDALLGVDVARRGRRTGCPRAAVSGSNSLSWLSLIDEAARASCAWPSFVVVAGLEEHAVEGLALARASAPQ